MGDSGSRAIDVVLVAEDHEDDVVLLRWAFAKAGVPNPIHIVRDGLECVAYLSGTGKYANRDEYPLPVLLLVDLKMPNMDGFEVLHWVRHNPGLKRLPIVVLTTSEDVFDINRAYELGANSFLIKTLDIQTFADLAEQLGRYWLSLSLAPQTERPPFDRPQRAQDELQNTDGATTTNS